MARNTKVYDKYKKNNLPTPYWNEEREIKEYVYFDNDNLQVYDELSYALEDITLVSLYYPFIDKHFMSYKKGRKRVYNVVVGHNHAHSFEEVLIALYYSPESFKIEKKDYSYYSEQELEYLRTEKRAEIADRIKVALGFGDLSENSEYDEAKGAQAENENKIIELENKLRHAKIIDESEIDTKTVQVGNTVKLFDMEFEEEVSYTIVGSTEVDLAQSKISNESPLGKALLGAKKNQIVDVQAPAGITKYKILSITI